MVISRRIVGVVIISWAEDYRFDSFSWLQSTGTVVVVGWEEGIDVDGINCLNDGKWSVEMLLS